MTRQTQPAKAVYTQSSVVLPFQELSRRAALWMAILYILIITLAELLTAFVNPVAGVIAYVVILLALFYQIATTTQTALAHVLIAMLLPPTIRLISLCLPLFLFDTALWYLIISIPLLTAAIIAMRLLGYMRRDAGFIFNLKGFPLQLITIVVGFLLGIIQYVVLRSSPITLEVSSQSFAISMLALMIGTGLVEELIFRGVVQRTAEKTLGSIGSILFTSLIYTALLISWELPLYLIIVFAANLFWGYVFLRTRSITGIALSHGLVNVMLFLIMPFAYVNPAG
jgi:membrane protease YdiL (CAAX protease family)